MWSQAAVAKEAVPISGRTTDGPDRRSVFTNGVYGEPRMYGVELRYEF